MLFNMFITFYTSRVVLEVLGIGDFGFYGVIGGFVSLFSFLNGCMASATSRFFTFALGRGDIEQLKKVFSAALTIHIIIAILVLILGEVAGLWWLKNKLIAPPERIEAAYWVFHLSVLTSVVNITQVPYNAAIIAHEKMNVYALVEMLNSLLKLVIVYLLVISSFDKLIVYSILMFCVALVITTIYKVYCLMHFSETYYSFQKNGNVIIPMLNFSGWELLGAFANVAKSQGNNILLNVFWGVILNAAYSIANQVYGAVGQFVNSIQLAVNPQIVKYYAIGNIEQFFTLIYRSSRLSYLMMLMLVFPIIYNIDYILVLWLKNPPVYAASFIVLILVDTMLNCLSGPLVTAAKAIGRIKYYQIIIGFLLFLNLPISYCFFLFFKSPIVMFLVGIVLSVVALIYRVYFLKKMVNMSVKDFWYKTCHKIVIVTIPLLVIYNLMLCYCGKANTFETFIFQSVFIILITSIVVYFIGLFKEEKLFIKENILSLFQKMLARK